MSVDWEREAARLARLARLDLAPEEAHALARGCEAITREFSALAEYARPLPPAAEPEHGAPRADVAHPAPDAEVDLILAAAPAVEGSSRKVVVPKGLP